MRTMVTVAKMDQNSIPEVSKLFAEFDSTEIPNMIGLRRRQLFIHDDIQIHLYDFAEKSDQAALEKVKTDPRMGRLAIDMKVFVTPYEPETWNSPADSTAFCFHDWEGEPFENQGRTNTAVTITRMDQAMIPAVSSAFREFESTESSRSTGIRRRQLFAFKDLCIHIQDYTGSNGADIAQKAASDIWFGKVVRDLPELALEEPATDGIASRFYGWEAS
ncbi:TcmI family type II polyketide cyclase [Streptomyces sp. NRRL F-2580]|uniref:TcmI family type II polyketide cyclase n=1 Tax=Streptomyces sp. NRRL F-2580 TaxID=1463841 RepID=UPI00131BDFF6|nr:TcmI family type II polyketide cyclase [Streptomyces sp. NRRL F-2580]